MPKGKYEARAHFPHRDCTLIVSVDMGYGDEDVALVRAKRIIREEFGEAVAALAEWSIERVESSGSTGAGSSAIRRDFNYEDQQGMICDRCGCERDLAHYCLDAVKAERDALKLQNNELKRVLKEIVDVHRTDYVTCLPCLQRKQLAEKALAEEPICNCTVGSHFPDCYFAKKRLCECGAAITPEGHACGYHPPFGGQTK